MDHLLSLGRIIPRRWAIVSAGLAVAGISGAWLLTHPSQTAPVELRAGFDTYIPYTMSDRDGRPEGLAVDVVTEAARRAHIKLKWVRTPDNADVEDTLRKGDVDFFPMLTLTPARQKEFHASESWWENETELISLEASPVTRPAAAGGKRIAIRGLPILKTLAESLFPHSVLVTIPGLGDMVDALCSGKVDAAFLDVRLLQSQLLKGPAACVGRAIHVVAVPGGSLSQSSIARKDVASAADRIYNQIAVLGMDGTISETASRWSMVSSFQTRHMKDMLDARQHAQTMRYGLLGLALALVLTWLQARFVRKARLVADHQAQHDWLTGLPNRRHFEWKLEQCVAEAESNFRGLGVFYFDLDGFKLINDTLGHAVGDEILKQVVHRIRSCVRRGDILTRMGGDEFAVIAPGVGSRESAGLIADCLLAGLQESFVIDDRKLLVSASIGISLFPLDGLDGTTLLQHADAAMYEAKRQGRNRQQFFNPAMNAAVRERLELENHLRRAIENGELSLHYQPEISLDSNEIVRYEALLRWNSPAFGTISPAKFIPIAEDTGLIVPIGAWVLEEACRHGRRLFDAGSNAGVGVNVSSVQFGRADFVDTVVGVLNRTTLPPCLLELELTETVVVQGLDDVVKRIDELRGMGVSISMDDFGTGYSSLSHLQKLSIDSLKIDRSFVRDIPYDGNALSLTNALVSLAHSLGMKVVVEGVETGVQLDAMREMGCDMAQGYFIGRPAADPALLECTQEDTA